MSLFLDLLRQGAGGTPIKKSYVDYGMEERQMRIDGSTVVLSKDGAEDIVVPIDKLLMRTTGMSCCYQIDTNDFFNSTCKVIKVDEDKVCYVVNDTWHPNKEAILPDRILMRGALESTLFNQHVYAKIDEDCSITLLNNAGLVTQIESDCWDNVLDAGMNMDTWYEVFVCWLGTQKPSVKVRYEGIIAPKLADVIMDLEHPYCSKYTVDSFTEEALTLKDNRCNLSIPIDKVLIRKDTWDQYFSIGKGDQIVIGSDCEFIGVVGDGYCLLKIDSWNPNFESNVVERITPIAPLFSMYSDERVFAMLREDGSIFIVNGKGNYADLKQSEYNGVTDSDVEFGVWYDGILDGVFNSSTMELPTIFIHGANRAPSMGEYISKKGYKV